MIYLSINKGVTYTSSNSSIVSVSSSGVLSRVGVGSCTIEVKSSANPSLTNTLNVTVQPRASDCISLSKNVSVSRTLTKEQRFWFKFTTGHAGPYKFESTGSTDTYGTLYTNVLDPNSYFYDNDDGGAGQNFLMQNIQLAAHTTYYLLVTGYNANTTGSFSVYYSGENYAGVYSYFDAGYSVHYGENTQTSQTNIGTYIAAVSARYKALLNLNIEYSVQPFTSQIDTWKGTVTSNNINSLNSSYTGHQAMHNYFKAAYPGSSSETCAYWTGHRTTYTDAGGVVSYNRSLSWGTNIYVTERASSANRYLNSTSVLMHELNHQYGAPDHYHDPVTVNNVTTCKNKTYCSTCGTNPRTNTCIMNLTRMDISSSNVLCQACENDIRVHLNNHH